MRLGGLTKCKSSARVHQIVKIYLSLSAIFLKNLKHANSGKVTNNRTSKSVKSAANTSHLQKTKKESSAKSKVSPQSKTNKNQNQAKTTNKTTDIAEYTNLATLIEMEKSEKEKSNCAKTLSNPISTAIARKKQAGSFTKTEIKSETNARYLAIINHTVG